MKKTVTRIAGESMILQQFLRHELGLTRKQIKQAKFRAGGIQVNEKQTRVTALLQPGDQVTVILEEDTAESRQLERYEETEPITGGNTTENFGRTGPISGGNVTGNYGRTESLTGGNATGNFAETEPSTGENGTEIYGRIKSLSGKNVTENFEETELWPGENAPGNFAKTESLTEGNAIKISEESSSGDLDIIYEDEDILAVNKPSGLVVHPSHGHYRDTLANQVYGYFKNKGEHVRIRPVGRLDKETSGIVIFAKNQVAAARLAKQKEDGIFSKKYLAMVQGIPDPPEGSIHIGISKEENSLMKMKADEHGMRAVTHYRVLRRFENASLVELWLETGRTHQIRVHMSYLGHPLLGDRIYGDAAAPDAAAPESTAASVPVLPVSAPSEALAPHVPATPESTAVSTAPELNYNGVVATEYFLRNDGAALHAAECVFRQPFTGEKIQLHACPMN